jgi:hypothetical protein
MKKTFFALFITLLAFHIVPSMAFSLTGSDAYGRPEHVKGPRFELWKDHDHWNLRWTGAGRKHHFRGTLKAPNGEVFIVHRHKFDDEDRIWKKRKKLKFDAWARKSYDGFSFKWTGDELVLNLEIDGKHSSRRIFIGHDSIHPSHHPFRILRSRHSNEKWHDYRKAGVIYASDASGRPEYVSGPRFELWKDHNRWHLRWTGAGRKHHFRGSLKAPDGEVFIIDRYKLEREDKLWKKRKKLKFNSLAKGAYDGFSFRWTGYELVLNLEIDGKHSSRRIFIGHDSMNPESTPFTIYRQRRDQWKRKHPESRPKWPHIPPPIYR